MVTTRGTLFQDQERQKRTLSSLRLHYFISNYRLRQTKMDPITPYSEKIDLRTEHGRKIYEACTKALPVVFDAAAGKHHSFLTALKNAADERCWRDVCLIPIGTPPIVHDLLLQPGKITLTDLHSHCSTLWSGTSSDQVQLQIKLNMMGVCLLNSVSAAVSQRLDTDKDKWYFKNRGGKDGLIIFKLLMQYSLQTTRYGSESTKDKLHTLNVKAFGNNVESMLLHRKTLLDDLQAQGQILHDDLHWAFKCLETVQQPETFVRYIEDKKTEWEEGSDLTAAVLCKFAETKYKHLFEAGKWKLTTASSAVDSKDKEDSKFVALVAAVKELAKTVSKPSDNPDVQKNKWKFEAPAAGAAIEKQVNGKMFWWCTGCDGKNHKPMYCRHKPQECKEQEKDRSKKVSIADDVNVPKPKSAAPKLQLNNKLATALAALDGALQQATDPDKDTSSETDFP